MRLRSLLGRLLPSAVADAARMLEQRLSRARLARLRPLSEEAFRTLLTDTLGLRAGQTVFVHSSIDQLSLEFPFYRVLTLLREAVGEEGTLLFPTFPRLGSYEFLKTGQVWDLRKTPSYTGVLTELARRQKAAVRSLHPTKSVVAIGARAMELVSGHSLSPYPFDAESPYRRLVGVDARIIGLGVQTRNLTFVHTVDDALGERFPVQPYEDELFKAPCVDARGERVIVPTYAHAMRKMDNDIPAFMRRHVPAEVCRDLAVQGMRFFTADARPLFATMLELAQRGTTFYRPAYRKRT
jgi:aminoglycoside 3-N-acetyltransferase